MIITGTLQEVSAQWIAVKVANATQPIRIPIGDASPREIAGAIGREVTITVRSVDDPAIAEDLAASTIPFPAVRNHARLIAGTASSLDVAALARLVETVASTVSALSDTLTIESHDRKHDHANASLAAQAALDLSQIISQRLNEYVDEWRRARAESVDVASLADGWSSLPAAAAVAATDEMAVAEPASATEANTPSEPSPEEAPVEARVEAVVEAAVEAPVEAPVIAEASAPSDPVPAAEVPEPEPQLPDDAPTVADAPISRRRRR